MSIPALQVWYAKFHLTIPYTPVHFVRKGSQEGSWVTVCVTPVVFLIYGSSFLREIPSRGIQLQKQLIRRVIELVSSTEFCDKVNLANM